MSYRFTTAGIAVAKSDTYECPHMYIAANCRVDTTENLQIAIDEWIGYGWLEKTRSWQDIEDESFHDLQFDDYFG